MAWEMAQDHMGSNDPILPLRKISLLRDQQSCLPLVNTLSDGDLLVLLSPVVRPAERVETAVDPFEPLGRALAARHPWVRHVPYTAKDGITGFHAVFIKKAKVVLFIVSGPSHPGQRSQLDLVEVARIVADHRPLVIVACGGHGYAHGIETTEFQTILKVPGYAPRTLEDVAAVLFGDVRPIQSGPLDTRNLTAPKQWEVEALPDSLVMYDIAPILAIWNECLPTKFAMDLYTLRSLLDRDGFGKHYVVKLPETREIVGFCATYTTWAFSDPDDLVGSLAVLLVRPAYRKRGIGLNLYNHATDLLTRTRGVKRLQLGSTFPRLLPGIPRESAAQDWFKKRGWDLYSQSPGRGKEICDWVLKIQDWPSGGCGTVPETYQFRTCTPEDFPKVMDFVRAEASHNETMGLFEEYKWSRDQTHDIVLCLQGPAIVAAALTYMANSGTTADNDLPWARRMGFDVGGITCICIAGEWNRPWLTPEPRAYVSADGSYMLRSHRNSVMIRLLGTCIELLQSFGMQQVFLDGVRGYDQGFQDLGFRKWALYRDAWQPV